MSSFSKIFSLQSGSANVTPASSTTTSGVGSALAAGSLVTVQIWDSSGVVGSISDTKGNTYTVAHSQTLDNNSGNGIVAVAYSVITHALTSTDTVTYNCGSGSASIYQLVAGWTGNATTGVYDSSASNKVYGTSSIASNSSGTPTESGELFLGTVAGNNGSSAGGFVPNSGWNLLSDTHETASPFNAREVVYEIGGASAVTYSPTSTITYGSTASLVTGFLPLAGTNTNTITTTLKPPTQSLAVTEVLPNHIVTTLPHITQSAEGVVSPVGTIIMTLPHITQTAEALSSQEVSGTITMTLPTLRETLDVTEVVVAEINMTLPSVIQTAIVTTEKEPLGIILTLPHLTQTMDVVVSPVGKINMTLPGFGQAFHAVEIIPTEINMTLLPIGTGSSSVKSFIPALNQDYWAYWR